MATARYIVLEHDGQWKINLDNRYYGPFTTRDEAVKSATETAGKAVSQGYEAKVMVMTDATAEAAEESATAEEAPAELETEKS